MRASQLTVELWLHPLAWHVLRRDYAYDGRAVDVKGWLYNMVCQGLQRQMVVTASELRRQRKGLVKGAVYISIYDYQHLGCYLRLSRQANISTAIYRQERERLCHLAAILANTKGISNNRAIREILIAEDISDEELSYEALKKYYQRKCGHLNEFYKQIINKLDIQ